MIGPETSGGETALRPRIVAIAGSLRQRSASHQLLAQLADLLCREGAEVRILDVRTLRLPFCSGDKHDLYVDYPDVARLREEVAASQGLALVTPEYHGSVSGVLKNVLDLLDFPHLEGKVVALASVLGGRSNCNALNHLRTVLRWCRSWTLPEQVALAGCRAGFEAAVAADPEYQERLAALAASLVRAARLLSSAPVPVTEPSLHSSQQHTHPLTTPGGRPWNNHSSPKPLPKDSASVLPSRPRATGT